MDGVKGALEQVRKILEGTNAGRPLALKNSRLQGTLGVAVEALEEVKEVFEKNLCGSKYQK